MIEGLAKYLSSVGVDFGNFATVFDIGSRDGRQSLQLAKLFCNATVVAIECNPETLDQCRRNAAKQPRIKLVEKAINSFTGRCRFFPIDTKRTITTWADGNPGASSLFVATGDYPTETYVQNEIEIACIRLDDLCDQLDIKTIDLIWMDLQGAELLALQSAGAYLDSVRYIYTEVSHRPIYAGQCLFDDVEAFLGSRGFVRCTQIDRRRWQQDAIYVNRREGAGAMVPAASNALQTTTGAAGGASGAMGAEARTLRLLLASARVRPSREVEGDIRKMLEQGIDWTLFARKAVEHELAGLCGRNLSRVAADLVPADILAALGAVIDETRRSNQKLFDELGLLLDLLASRGIAAIPIKGPVLAIQAFDDLGLRRFGNLDFLIHDRDLRQTIAALREVGYERQGELTEVQFEMTPRLQGQEVIFRQSIGTAIEPTRLTPITMALDIGYTEVWRRAQPAILNGRSVLTLAPEDCLIALAIHGAKELWRNIKWACDVAALIDVHSQLDWIAVENRARAQDCLQMVLSAVSLARRYLGAAIPDRMRSLEQADHAIEPMVERILAHWQAAE